MKRANKSVNRTKVRKMSAAARKRLHDASLPFTATDHTGKFDADWDMFSYRRAANLFWQGVAAALENKRFDERSIRAIMQSKDMRWMLDRCEEELTQLGYDMLNKYSKSVKGIKPSFNSKD